MSVSIVTCPSCQTLLLNDTAQCPNCQMILDTDRIEELESLRPAEPQAPLESRSEEPCGQCGEMVRIGLVRCWNCGEFMRGDIAQVYEQMQASESPVIYSRLPSGATSVKPAPPSPDEDSSGNLLARDEDFELSPEFSMQTPAPRPASATAEAAAEATRPAAAEASEPAAESGTERSQDAATEETVSHSEATGGDVLLQVALQEEAEVSRRPKGARRGPRGLRGFLVYCPNGHRIEAQEHHRGRMGRCPRCKSPFYVPFQEEEEAAKAAAADGAKPEGPGAVAAGKYTRWMSDVHWHTVNPQKLKLKPGALQNDFQQRDFGFSPEDMIAVSLVKKGGLFGGNEKKKKEQAREAVYEHLREGKSADKLPAGGQHIFTADQMRQVGLAQPFPYAHESLFAGIPVFGDGRIAVKFPKVGDGPELYYASFALSQFREFAAAMAELYGVAALGAEYGVPLEDQYETMFCHYSEEKLHALQNLDFYKADPSYKLKLIGRKCQACGLVVSEDSRKKEKIGGANGKGIAKAKCPKCGQKFGDISLFALETPEEKSESGDSEKSEAKEKEAVAAS